MKTMMTLAATLSLLGGAAQAQVMQDSGPFQGGVFGSVSGRNDERGMPMINVFFEEGMGGSSKSLADLIVKELNKSPLFDLVSTPTESTRIIAPTSLAVPANGKGAMKVGFQIAFPRGSEMEFSVRCDVGKPADCARGIRSRAERLYREYIEMPVG